MLRHAVWLCVVADAAKVAAVGSFADLKSWALAYPSNLPQPELLVSTLRLKSDLSLT